TAASPSRTVTNIGYIFVRETGGAAYTPDWDVTIQWDDIVGGTQESVHVKVVVSAVEVQGAAEAIAAAINSALVSAYTAAASPIHASLVGIDHPSASDEPTSVIAIRSLRDASINGYLTGITVADPFGGSGATSFIDEIDDISDLPLNAVDGSVVRLVGEDTFSEAGSGVYTRAVLVFRETEVLTISVTDDDKVGSAGFWEEGPAYDVDVEIDASTMPHVLIRRQDDASGTVTGEPFGIYFDFDEFTWADRLVGDDEKAPFPSFVSPSASDPRYIRGVGFFQNRLVLTALNNIAMSESSQFGNFFRTTLRTLPDSDRIDVTISVARDTVVQHVIPAHDTLYGMTNGSITKITYGDFLSPRSVGISELAGIGTGIFAQPGSLGDSVLVVDENDCDWAQVHGVFRGDVATTAPLTAEVQQFIPRNALYLQTHARTSLAVILPSTKDSLYCVRHLISGTNVIQNAWFTIDIAPETGGIAGACVLADRLFLVTRRGGSTHLESLPLQSFPSDTNGSYRVLLDARVDEHTLLSRSYSSGPDETTLVLPYTPTDGDLVRVVRASAAAFGEVLIPDSVVGDTVTLTGDYSAEDLIIGTLYDASIEPLPPRVIESGRAFDGRSARPSAVEAVVRMTVESYRTAGYDVEVDYGGAVSTDTYSQSDPLVPTRGELQVFLGGSPDDLGIAIKARGTTPVAIPALEWEADVHLDSPA
ncbi:MAG TPA: hypothetical protein VJ997_09250, partial [Longimicrobiales bacterium]|nr:hypothetical protein [Longimicrobiales bacterium]